MDPKKFRKLCVAAGMDPVALESLKRRLEMEDDWKKIGIKDEDLFSEDDGGPGTKVNVPPEYMDMEDEPIDFDDLEKPKNETEESKETEKQRKDTYQMTDEELEGEMELVIWEGSGRGGSMERAKEIVAEMTIRAWRRGVEEGKKMSGV